MVIPVKTMETYKTSYQVEIEKLDENNEYNYRIVYGNPLTSDIHQELFANSLKLNDYAFATSGMEIGEYQKDVKIEKHNTLVNIVLED